MKPKSIVGIILGLILMVVAVGAFFSGEPASVTTQGRIVTIIVFVAGVSTLLGGIGNVSQNKKAQGTDSVLPHIYASPIVATTTKTTCAKCGKPISPDFKVCPYCSATLQSTCPQCHNPVEDSYNVCPICGYKLK